MVDKTCFMEAETEQRNLPKNQKHLRVTQIPSLRPAINHSYNNNNNVYFQIIK